MDNTNETIDMMTMIDPYLYELMMQFVDEDVVIQTTRNSLQGMLMSVMPDHVVIQVGGTLFYVRIAEIIWITKGTP